MRLIVIVFSLFMIFGGIYDTYISYSNPQPVRMSVSEYTDSDKSKAVYVTITDPKINILNSVVLGSKLGGGISRIYVPIEAENFEQKDKITLILNSSDSSLVDIANELYSLPESEQLQYMVRNIKKLTVSEPLSGRLMYSGLMEKDRKEEVLKLMKNLDKDFYVLNHNGAPSMVRGPVMAVIGLIMFLLAAKRKVKRFQSEKEV